MSTAVDSLATTVVEMQRKLDAAVLAERERCAKIAQFWGNLYATGEGEICANEIAAAIRKPSSLKGTEPNG